MSNHTLLMIGAFMLLTSVLLGFYRILGSTGDDIGTSQDLILATTITTSYLELANGLAFDEITDTSHVGLGNPSSLTHPSLLGTDSKLESTAWPCSTISTTSTDGYMKRPRRARTSDSKRRSQSPM